MHRTAKVKEEPYHFFLLLRRSQLQNAKIQKKIFEKTSSEMMNNSNFPKKEKNNPSTNNLDVKPLCQG